MALQQAECTPDTRASQLIKQVATADHTELRRLLNVLNTSRSCDQHDRLCVIEHTYVRALIMLKAARDVRPHDWMFNRDDSLHNALSLCNDTLLKLNQVMSSTTITYEERCSFQLTDRDVTYEALVIVSMLGDENVSSQDKPDMNVLFRPDVNSIEKALKFGFKLSSRRLPVYATI